jgi:hypothetical protein
MESNMAWCAAHPDTSSAQQGVVANAAGKVAEFGQNVWGAVTGKEYAPAWTTAGGGSDKAGGGYTKTSVAGAREEPETPAAAVEAAVESGVTSVSQASMFSSVMPWVVGAAMALLIGGVVVGVVVRREGSKG